MKHDADRFAADAEIAPIPLASAPRSIGACVTPLVEAALVNRERLARRPRAAHTLRAWLAHEVAQCRDDAALQRLMIARGYAVYIGAEDTLICTSDGEPICPLDDLRAVAS